jgi:molybdate transport system regulatory protein
MKGKQPNFRIRSKVWIEDEKGRTIFGMGRMNILQAILDHGSINAAAKSLGMSYRAVWGKINDTEKRLGKTLLIRQVGGEAGGGSELTPVGKNLVEKFRKLHAHIEYEVKMLFEESFQSRLEID